MGCGCGAARWGVLRVGLRAEAARGGLRVGGCARAAMREVFFHGTEGRVDPDS